MDELAQSIRGRRPYLQIQRMQSFFARYKYWEQDEFSTPSEMHAAGGGDCKSFAAAKYYILLRAGVSVDQLWLVFMQLPDRSHHLALRYGDVLVDRIRDTYTIPNVPAQLKMDWNHHRIRLYWGGGWQDSPISEKPADCFLCRWGPKMRAWRVLLKKLKTEVESGKISAFERLLQPSAMELVSLQIGEDLDLRDISDATWREVEYVKIRCGNDPRELVKALSPRARNEMRRYLERNHVLLVSAYNKMRIIQQ